MNWNFVVRWSLVLALAGTAFADERVAVDRHGNAVAIYDVGALTHPRPWFKEEPLGADYDSFLVSTDPVFPYEHEDWLYPHGSADELIEVLKTNVEPWFWEEDGAEMAAHGEDRVVVRASPAIHKKVRTYLNELDDDPTVVIELLAAPLPSSALGTWLRKPVSEAIEQLAGKPDVVRASVSALANFEATVTRGLHQAIVGNLYGIVRGGVARTSPHILVGRSGFVASVMFRHGADDKFVLTVDASLGDVDSSTERAGVDLQQHRVAQWRGSVTIPDGAWRHVGAVSTDAQTVWALFARATQPAIPEPLGIATTFLAPPKRFDKDASAVIRRFSIAHLQQLRHQRFGDYGALTETGAPPAPPELADPEPTWNPDALVELIQALTGEAYWEEGVIQASNGTLYVHTHPGAVPVIEQFLSHASALESRRFVMDVGVYDAPARTIHTTEQLLAAIEKGDARVLGFSQLRAAPGARNASRSGRTMRYVADFDTDAADGLSVTTPEIRSVFLGLVADIHPQLDIMKSQALTTVRVSYQSLVDIRERTDHGGKIQLPSVHVFRTQTTARLLLEKQVIVSQVDSGPRARILTLTPRLEP